MNCCVCGDKLNLLDGSLFPGEMFHMTCKKCTDILGKIEQAKDFSYDRNEYYELEADLNSRYNLADHEANFAKIYGDYLKNCRDELKKRLATEEELSAEVVYPEDSFMRTSGQNFEGYRIVKYIDIVSAETILSNVFYNNLFSDPNELSEHLKEAREEAMRKFISLCVEKGANAAIGVDFNYVSFSTHNSSFAVIAHGTAVKIEEL
ncbi:MAG: YbjQ family protein [Ruminococcaceae bacterium]|nr:YbjQ family protein [Oscillospiraceae bacterium]